MHINLASAHAITDIEFSNEMNIGIQMKKQIIWENAKICVECVALEIGRKLFRPATKMYRSSGLALRVLNLMKEIEAEIRDMCCVGHEFHCCCHNIPGE